MNKIVNIALSMILCCIINVIIITDVNCYHSAINSNSNSNSNHFTNFSFVSKHLKRCRRLQTNMVSTSEPRQQDSSRSTSSFIPDLKHDHIYGRGALHNNKNTNYYYDDKMIPIRKIYGGATPSSSFIDTSSTSLNILPPVIVGIAGGSGSGKSTLTQAIIKQLGEEYVTYIQYDSYYKDISHLSIEERAKANFDHPESLDTELLKAHIKELKLGKSVNVPEYCYKTHSRLNTYIPTHLRRIIIVDGVLLFHDPELCSILDMKIFVDAEDDVRLIRRLRRDTVERARIVESVLDQYSQTVKPMHYLFVEPSKKHADIIIPSNQGIQAVALDICLSRLREIINYYQ